MTIYRVTDVDLPDEGAVMAAAIDGRTVVVVRVDRAVYALDGECTHQRCSLADGELEGTMLCPCHFAEFDVRTGEVLADQHQGRCAPALHGWSTGASRSTWRDELA